MSEKVEDNVEQAELDAYMEADFNGEYSEEKQISYLKERLGLVKEEYSQFVLLRQEAVAIKNDTRLADLSKMFRDNFLTRRYLVTRLRSMGQKVEDRFVPLSAKQ